MGRKKLIRLAIFILIIITGLVIVENSIRGIATLVENNKENKKQEENLEKYKETEEYKETVMLEGVVGEIAELLNNNEVDTLYELIDPNYKDYKFQNNKELYDEYIKKYVNENSEITLQSYNKVNGKFVCRLLSESSEGIKNFVVIIEKKENSSPSIIFDNITSIKKNGNSDKNKKISYEILYTLTASETLAYNMEFTNIANNNIKYKCNSISITDTFGNIFTTEAENFDIELKPKETKRQNIVFYDSKIHKFPKTMLSFKLIDENGNEEVINMYIEEVM